MTIRLGEVVPDFTAESTQGPINFYEWLGVSWAILFSHPKDFTPVCTTELGVMAKLKDTLAQRGVKILALSVDNTADHKKWITDINETQNCVVDFPIIGDVDRRIAMMYGMINHIELDPQAVRSVFVVDPDRRLKMMLAYPASTGRNFDEILRVITSLQLAAQYSVATPANWTPGQDCIIWPSVPDEDLPTKFPKGHKVIRPYLRTTPQPDL